MSRRQFAPEAGQRCPQARLVSPTVYRLKAAVDRLEASTMRPRPHASTNGRGRPPTAGGRSRLCVGTARSPRSLLAPRPRPPSPPRLPSQVRREARPQPSCPSPSTISARQSQTPASGLRKSASNGHAEERTIGAIRERGSRASRRASAPQHTFGKSNCMDVSRSPAEPVEAWHDFSCQRRKAERRGDIERIHKAECRRCVCTLLAKPLNCGPYKQCRRLN